MSISIIIVTYNNQNEIKDCIDSIISEIQLIKGEIIIVENNSSDLTKQEIETLSISKKMLKTIYNPDNRGYAKANNQGILLVKNEFVLFLNPDTILAEGSIVDLKKRIENDPKIAAIAPQLVFPNRTIQSSCRRFPNYGFLLSELFGLNIFFKNSKFFNGWKMGDFNHKTERIVDQPMGAALMVKLDILEKLNGFDEKFSMFFNDVDLCKRIYLMGKNIIFFPLVVIIHKKGASIDKQLNKMILSSQLSFIKYLFKHFAYFIYYIPNFLSTILLLINLPFRIFIAHIKKWTLSKFLL